MIRKILIATDGSETAQKAVDYAIDLARQTEAEIILLTSIDPRFFVSPSIPAAVSPTHLNEPVEEYLRQTAQVHLEEMEDLCRERGVTCRTVIRSGHPVEAIIKEAEESAADLIVLGSHGKSALRAALLGSVTFGVVHKDTRIPVLVVRRANEK